MSKGGTPNYSQQPLCLSCRFATVLRGYSTSQLHVSCSQLEHVGLVQGNVPFPVYDCSMYMHKLDKLKHELEGIAYILERKGNVIGFKPPKRRGEDD